MEFHGDGDNGLVDDDAELAANSITVLKTDEIVEPGMDKKDTSGSLIVEARSGMIDVATVQVNTMDGSSDTVVYIAE